MLHGQRRLASATFQDPPRSVKVRAVGSNSQSSGSSSSLTSPSEQQLKVLEHLTVPPGFKLLLVGGNSMHRITRWQTVSHGVVDVSEQNMARETMAFKVGDPSSNTFSKGNWLGTIAQCDGVCRTQDVLNQLAGIESDSEKAARLRYEVIQKFESIHIPEMRQDVRIPPGNSFLKVMRRGLGPVTRWKTEHYGIVDVSQSYLARETMAFKVKDPSHDSIGGSHWGSTGIAVDGAHMLEETLLELSRKPDDSTS